MSISRTIYDSFCTSSGQFDAGKFVEAALLFDKVLISSSAILPELVKAVGSEGLLHLLESGLLEVVGGGPTAQATCDYKNPGFFDRNLFKHPLVYGVETLHIPPTLKENPSAEERIEKDLKQIKKYKTTTKQELAKLNYAIVRSMKIIDGSKLNINDDFRDDINSKQDFIVEIILNYLDNEKKIPIHIFNWKIKVEELREGIFHINTNLDSLLKIDTVKLHELLKTPLFQLTGTHLQLQRMRAVEAAAGLTEIQSKITMKRIDFLSKVHNESDKRGDFSQIREAVDVPMLSYDSKFNVEELIKLRESDEARSFRDWIQSSESLTDQEIRDLTSDWKKKLGEKLKTKDVKGLRWLTSTGVGQWFGDTTGTIGSGIDFFLEKFLPGMGPIGFVGEGYKEFIANQKDTD